MRVASICSQMFLEIRLAAVTCSPQAHLQDVSNESTAQRMTTRKETVRFRIDNISRQFDFSLYGQSSAPSTHAA
jgi:hypothetical protein